MIVPLNY